MVIRHIHGKPAICQHYMAISEINIGTEWISPCGTIIVIDKVNTDDYIIYYHNVNNPEKRFMKDSVTFQSKYSKII
jgi:hypothetical protein